MRRTTRRRFTKGGAFKRDIGPLNQAVAQLYRQVISNDRMILEYGDYLSLFVPPELHESWMDMSQRFEMGYSRPQTFSLKWPHVGINEHVSIHLTHVDGKFAPAVPKNTAPSPLDRGLYDAVEQWLLRRTEAHDNWRMVNRTLKQLDEHCKTPEQVRYFWPVIQIIIARAGSSYERAYADAMSNPDPRARSLPLELRRLCTETSGFVTAATLVDYAPAPDRRPVEINYREYL